MNAPHLTLAAALLLGSAAISGCTKDELELTPEQEAEIQQSVDDAKKRGWIEVPPMSDAEVKGQETKPEAKADGSAGEDDPFAGSDLPASEMPPTE